MPAKAESLVEVYERPAGTDFFTLKDDQKLDELATLIWNARQGTNFAHKLEMLRQAHGQLTMLLRTLTIV